MADTSQRISGPQKDSFLETLWSEYDTSGRDNLPWRNEPYLLPYPILVSEFMLQQTQVPRVVPKFLEFLQIFPDIPTIRAAKQSEVVSMWSGLGYYRRAKFLHASMRLLPDDSTKWTAELLKSCPGIGPNTAGAIRAYAFNVPELFVETNIRTVLLHHFFATEDKVSDSMLLSTLEQVLDTERPRDFYWAMMDYGSSLKQQGSRIARASTHYKKQSPFEGSDRQVRAKILQILISSQVPRSKEDIIQLVDDDRAVQMLDRLIAESMVEITATGARLKE